MKTLDDLLKRRNQLTGELRQLANISWSISNPVAQLHVLYSHDARECKHLLDKSLFEEYVNTRTERATKELSQLQEKLTAIETLLQE
jgi:hypothetical protein